MHNLSFNIELKCKMHMWTQCHVCMCACFCLYILNGRFSLYRFFENVHPTHSIALLPYLQFVSLFFRAPFILPWFMELLSLGAISRWNEIVGPIVYYKANYGCVCCWSIGSTNGIHSIDFFENGWQTNTQHAHIHIFHFVSFISSNTLSDDLRIPFLCCFDQFCAFYWYCCCHWKYFLIQW